MLSGFELYPRWVPLLEDIFVYNEAVILSFTSNFDSLLALSSLANKKVDWQC